MLTAVPHRLQLRETLGKKAFSQHRNRKKRLRKRAHVLFSRPVSHRTVRPAHRLSQH
jgi:hypothetical protein